MTLAFQIIAKEGRPNKGDSRQRHLQGKGAYSGLVRQAGGGGVLSLSLCNLAIFDHLYLTKYIQYELT